MNPNGYSVIRKRILKCLDKDKFQHAQRNNVDIKNLLATGAVSKDEIIEFIKKSNGALHESSPHHFIPDVLVHIIKNDVWYVKFYFLNFDDEDVSVFISVHN
jgi:hypothetical protein